ncbi:MAG TPA: prepilin-type N-terminal cleavage/methylation domain-containing protein [Fimbriimonadaceae bacterium]|nr:prepilin-type N-terminal cleavage/methylation domain-containing protein [Fimbriimonadaceae bacterium]
MNSRIRKKAFTLIELLVVIAIIAILAAILFPVFAQAKRMAKGAVALSNDKQLALSELMYMNDADDLFPPTVEYDASWNVYPFTYKCQPYMKNWGILQDPTGPLPADVSGADADAGFALSLYGEWGMGPRQAATDGSFSSYVFGTSATGSVMTKGAQWVYDGIGGVVNNSGGIIWSAYGYKAGATPSLTSSNIAAPADQVMIAQSGTWDFMWQQDNADSFDLYWSSCYFNTYGCKLVTTAPVARQRDNDGPTVGWYPWPGGTPTQEPTGLTVWTGTDGHAKATPWRTLMGVTVPINNGTQRAIKAFWPQGS